jgi:hypothetical protein
MSGAPIVVPFDFDPVNTVENTTSYTVPVGKYALVTIEVWAKAVVNQADTVQPTVPAASVGNVDINSDSKSESIQLWLSAGDAVTMTGSNASGTTSMTSAGGETRSICETKETSVAALVNTTEVLKVVAESKAAALYTFSGAGTFTVGTHSGDHGIRIHASEYNPKT